MIHLLPLFATVSSSTGISPGLWASIAAFAAATALFFVVARRALASRQRTTDRLCRALPGDRLDEPDLGIFGELTPALAAQLPETRRGGASFRKLLRSAGYYQPSAAQSVYALRFVLLVGPLVAAGLLAILSPSEQTFGILVGGCLASAVLSIVPRLYVWARRNRRRQAIQAGLPDTLDMLSMCLGGGMPLAQSLAHVAGQLPHCPALAEELLILRRQAEVGSLKQALADFCARNDLPETRQLVNLLTRGERLGTRVAGSLMEQADRLRETRKQSALRQANKTPVKLVLPIMFCFAPAALILLVGPAMLELKEFLAPSVGRSVLSTNEGLGTRGIFRTLENLDQGVRVP
jgi:tight adherence protein C